MAEQPEPTDELDQLRDLVSESDGGAGEKKKTDRRGMLRMAGAALIGAAGAAAVRAIPASAANGDTMIVGGTMQGTSATLIEGSFGGTAVFVGESNATGGIGLQGSSSTGVKGLGAAQGTDTAASEVGVLGTSKSGSGTGVQGSSSGGVGVQGSATSGAAGFFVSTTGYDAQLGVLNGDSGILGSGRLAMIGRGDVGGSAPNWNPTFFSHSSIGILNFQHEFVRGNDASIWASRFDDSSATARARWKRINTVRTDTIDGLGTPFKPVRVADTRLLTSPIHGLKAPGSMTLVTVGGAGTGASSIPFDAIAVMGNLTAVGYGGPGFMAIMPGGIAVGVAAGQYNPNADPSSVNFITGQGAIANSFICGLHNGQLQVYVGGASAYFIVDVTAYLQ